MTSWQAGEWTESRIGSAENSLSGNIGDIFRAVATVAALQLLLLRCGVLCAAVWQLLRVDYADMVTRLPATCDCFFTLYTCLTLPRPLHLPHNVAWQSSQEHTSCHSTHTHTYILCMCVCLVRAWADESFASSHANNLMSNNVRCKILFNTPTQTHTATTHTHTHLLLPHTAPVICKSKKHCEKMKKKTVERHFMLRFHYAQFERQPATPTRSHPCHTCPATPPALAARYAQSPTILSLVNLPLMPQRNATQRKRQRKFWLNFSCCPARTPSPPPFPSNAHNYFIPFSGIELTCKLGGQWSSSSSICLIFCASCITKFNSMSNSPPTSCKYEREKEREREVYISKSFIII